MAKKVEAKKVEKTIEIGKKDLKMIRGSVSKTKTVYTVAFSTESVLSAALPLFKSYGVKPLSTKGTPTKNGLEVRLEALEASLIRTAIRLIKGSTVATYRGSAPTYIKKASDQGIKLAKSLEKASTAKTNLLKALVGEKKK